VKIFLILNFFRVFVIKVWLSPFSNGSKYSWSNLKPQKLTQISFCYNFECGNNYNVRSTDIAHGEVQRNIVNASQLWGDRKCEYLLSVSYHQYLLFSCVLTPNTFNVEHTTFCDLCVVRSSRKKIFIESWVKFCRIILETRKKLSHPPPIHTSQAR
jgi:hypothetical protein